MASNGHAPVRWGDDPTGLVWLDQPELDFVLKEISRAPSGKFEDGRWALMHKGQQVAQGDAAAVTGELRKRRAYASIPLVAMDFIDDRSCVYCHRDADEVAAGTSPIVWRSDKAMM
jgi:hypothetical protein